jgi:hypothetical protein
MSLKYLCLLSITFLFITGCSKHNQIKSDLQAVSDRLESFTELTIVKNSDNIALNAPAKTSMEYPIEDMRIKLRDFYAVDDCPLGQFIAERNTALGKMQLPSTRFAYEHRLLRVLEGCMAQLEQDHPMQAQMKEWLDKKTTNLPLVWANMMSQSQETFLAFTTASDFISGESSDGLQVTKLALNYLLQAMDTEYIDSQELELHLKGLLDSRLPARMWRTQELIAQQLPPISDLLARYIERTKCTNAQQEQEVTIMRNIFSKMFADKVQPLASQLNHYQYQLNPAFEALVEHPNIPPSFSSYVQSQYIDSAQLYKTAMQENIELWQQVFKLCDA